MLIENTPTGITFYASLDITESLNMLNGTGTFLKSQIEKAGENQIRI